MPKKNLARSSARGLQQILSKKRFKSQNNNPKNGAGALASAPFLGRAPLAAQAMLFWNLYRLLKEFAGASGWASGQVFFLAWIIWHFSSIFFDIFFGEKIVKPTKIIFGQIDFSKIGSCKNDFSQNRIFQNRFLFLSVFPKPNLSKKSANFAKCFLNIQVSSKVFAGVQGLPAPHSLGLPGRQPPHIYGMVWSLWSYIFLNIVSTIPATESAEGHKNRQLGDFICNIFSKRVFGNVFNHFLANFVNFPLGIWPTFWLTSWAKHATNKKIICPNLVKLLAYKKSEKILASKIIKHFFEKNGRKSMAMAKAMTMEWRWPRLWT